MAFADTRPLSVVKAEVEPEPAPEPTEAQRWAWVLYAGPLTAVSIPYLFGLPWISSGPVFNVIGISPVFAILIGLHLNKIRPRLPWYLIALGQTFFVAGDVISYNYERFFGHALPFPSIADAFYLAVYPAYVAGILLLIRQRTPGRDRASLIDSMIIAVGVGILSWVFLMAPYAHDATLSLGVKLTSIAYPLMDLMLITVVVRLAVGAGRGGWSMTLLVLAPLALFVTDAVYGWLLLHGGYETGGLLDGGWIISYLLLGAVALHPSVHSISERAAKREMKFSWTRLTLLAGASLAAPAVQAAMNLSGRHIDVPVVAITGGVSFLLVVARMADLMRQQEQTEARFSSLVQNSTDVVSVISPDMTVLYVSPSVERVLGHATAQLEGKSFIDLVHPDDVSRVLAFCSSSNSADDGPALSEFTIRHRNGGWLEVETLRTDLLEDKNVEGIVLNTRDISERKAFQKQLEHHAFYDTVTGLANRALFRDRVDHALAQARRSLKTVAVIFLDLDDFKIVNDSFGHEAGDALLREVGSRLKACLRTSDTAARLGGDEFAILLEETDGGVDPAEVAERIQRGLSNPFRIDGKQHMIRASLGIAYGNSGTGGESGTDDVLRNADVAMYMAKGRGKGRTEVYQPTMHKRMLQRLELKGDLQHALDDDQFVLHYQPLIDLETERISGLEALVRWNHPERGMIAPAEFIPMAEETGLIIPIGSWVLDTACKEARRLQQKYPQETPFTISVNLSARQLQWPGIVSDVRKALRTSGLPPTSLTLEVTETVMMQNVELSVLRLKELKALDVQIAIDDFGAGYSSLGYIRRFPVDIIKVDKAFIDRIDEGGEELELTAAIIHLAKVLNLNPVAEGVERAKQFERLLSLGCTLAQGFYFAKPEASELVERRIFAELNAGKPGTSAVA
jgi:diguanylate cyclase (GGDEF)-like protein/PAS domain S-box-containing protein